MEPIIVGVSVLMVFLTFLLHGVTERVDELRKKTKYLSRKDEMRALNKKLTFTTLCQSLPVTLIYFATSWVILPRTWQIITTYQFSIWNFDELSTIYVLMDIGLLGMFLFAAIKTSQSVAKWIEKGK